MANIFKEAKKIQRQHPRMEWQEAIQMASRKHKRSSKQSGSSNRTADKKRSARPPGARIPKGGKKVTYYERRKNRSDVPGSLTGVSPTRLKAELKRKLNAQEDRLVVQKYRAKKKTAKRKIQKKIVLVKSALRKLS